LLTVSVRSQKLNSPMRTQIYSILGSLVALAQVHAVDIPEDIPGAPGSGRDPGFRVRSLQAPAPGDDGIGLPSLLNRGIFQLNSTLTDDAGNLVTNEAKAGTNADGTFSVDVINFEQDALVEDVNGDLEAGGGPITNFQPNALFPGIPGNDGHTTNFTTEIVTYLELTAGEHTFGGQVWVGRTDAAGGGDDDLFAVYSATNPRDFSATKLGEFVKSAEANPFASAPDNYTFTFTAPSDGLYPFRLLYIQKTGGAGLEWYSVDSASQDKILINDLDDARAIKAFQRSTATNHNHPYVAEIRPQPGSKGIPAADKLEILLIDSDALVDGNSVALFHNGLDITGDANLTTSNGRTSLSYQPNPARVDLANAVKLSFDDTAGRSFEQEWDFEISAGAGVTKVTGQWDFDADLSATSGSDMEFLTAAVEAKSSFGTTASFGIANIDGEVANVMSVPAPGDLDGGAEGRDIGYVMYHGMDPNGGGTRVNQYTLIMDVLIVDGGGAAGMIQIDSPRPGADGVIPNTGDSDYFWQGGNMGQGGGGYNGDGSFTPDEWHRAVFAVDLAADPRLVTKYLDGVKQDDWKQNSIDQARRALLDDYAILFTDGDQDEQRAWFVNSVQIREGKMSDVEIELLGGPKAEGIPLSFFDDPNATVSTRNSFGDLGNNLAVQTRRIVVFNSGETKDLTIASVAPTGPEKDFYTVVSFPETLASAEQGTIVVEFDPNGGSGVFEAGLEIISNDGGEGSITLDVTARVDNPSGLVAHYQMDETEGTTMLDASGQRYHGEYGSAGGGSFVLGQGGLATGNAVRFSDGGTATDGGGFGQLDANASIPSLQNLTVSMWVQPDAADVGASMLLAKGKNAGDPFALATNAVGDTNPLLWFVQENTAIESDPVLSVGEKHHVVITQLDENGLELGSTRTRLYVDGELIAELEDSDGYEDVAPTVIQIGALNGGFGFTGVIDDVQIYSRELSTEDVQFLFGNPGTTAAAEPEGETPLADVTVPSDPVVLKSGENDDDADAGPPPGAEGVENAINDTALKYLDFRDLGSGFIVTPSVGATVVSGLRLYPANDSVERDPASYQLLGSTTGPDGDFVLISEGPLDLPETRNDAGLAITPSVPNQDVRFDNSTAYLSYWILFPTLKDAAGANSMQIGEVEFLGTTGEIVNPVNPVNPAGPQITGISATSEGVALQLPAGVPYVIEYSEDLVTWTPIVADVVGSFTDTDPARTDKAAGYYRGVAE
jgi:hypothetical protein